MTFGREKRLLLGWLALLAPIPLPFNQVLEWPILFLYCLAVIYFLQRADSDAQNWLPNWALNGLGLLYLPFFVADIRLTFDRSSPVKALLHLILFLVVVKLFSIRQEKDKWHLMVAIFFVFVGAMATSSHITVGLYLLVFLVAGLLALARLAHLHVVAGQGWAYRDAANLEPMPIRGPLIAGALLVLLVAVPLFAAMPRFREPFVLGQGAGVSGIGRTTGFSDSVDLDLTTSIRGNRNVAMRIQYQEELENPGELRFKGATFEHYENRRWFRRLQRSRLLQPKEGRVFRLGPAPSPSRRAEIFLEPLPSSGLVLPSETASLEIDFFPTLGLDPGGAVLVPVGHRRETLRYQVELAPEPVIAAQLDSHPESELTALEADSVTPRMLELAESVMGDGTPGERLDRLETHLINEYTYTTDLLGRTGDNPIEDFLFTYRSGHCEFFASAMVLLLRSQGIPARFVTGFLGAEFNPLESYYIVRQQNAHAWVEAYTPERGWQVYDPTPPEGRPSLSARGLRLFLTQLVDFVTFRWDRYVLTYGAEDQRSFFEKMKERFRDLLAWWKQLRSEDETGETGRSGQNGVTLSSDELLAHDAGWQPRRWLQIAFCVCLLGLMVVLLLLRRRSFKGETAYLGLRALLRRSGVGLDDTCPPLEVERLALATYPQAADAVRHLMAAYLHESFAARELDSAERTSLKDAWQAIRRTARSVGHRRPGSRPTTPAPA